MYEIKRHGKYHKVNIPEVGCNGRCDHDGKKQGKAGKITDQLCLFISDKGISDAEKKKPKSDTHAPQKAIDRQHAAEL